METSKNLYTERTNQSTFNFLASLINGNNVQQIF